MPGFILELMRPYKGGIDMKALPKRFLLIMIIASFLLAQAGLSISMTRPGKFAPVFQEEDLRGNVHDLSQMKGRPMTILYFFDVDSDSSRKLLKDIGELKKNYAEADLNVLGITRSDRTEVENFVKQSDPGFPILLDDSGVSDLYQARVVLPVSCIIGPDLKIVDYFQGGGKTTEIMLVRLAERNLQRRQINIARAISEHVIRKNPKNAEAKAVKGYAELKEGNIGEAEDLFRDIAGNKGEAEVLGKEGLAMVYAKKGEKGKAYETAEEVGRKAPERSFPHVVKGDLLYRRGKKELAAKEYEKAVEKTEGALHQKALAFNQFGRFFASLGKYSRARQLYDQAVEIDPYYIEATSNKGIAYEKEGNWGKALDSYRQVVTLNDRDTFAAVMAKKAEQMLQLKRNSERSERVDRLVKELAERYRSQKSFWPAREDTWTSRPMVMAFVDFQEKGGLSERDGFSTFITADLTDRLNESGRVRVIERVLLERLLEELNLGSSDLADPETSLKLGRVLAAKILGTGSLFFMPGTTLLNMRLIDTETSGIAKVFSKELDFSITLEDELNRLNREILSAVISKYPLRGFVIKGNAEQAVINLGANQGVVLGTRFEILEEQEPFIYKGKTLKATPKSIGVIEVTGVEPDFSYCTVIQKEKPIQTDHKIRELIEQSAVAMKGRL